MPADGTRPQVELDIMEGLRAEGFIRGTNMEIEWRHTEGDRSLFPVIAQQFVTAPVDILIASTTSAAIAAQAATHTIPIVMQGAADAVDYGVVMDYSHPGGNITGTAFDNTQEALKRLELFHEAFPTIKWVVVLGTDPSAIHASARLTLLRRTAASLGIEISAPVLETDDDVPRVLESAANGGGLMTGTTSFGSTARILSFAAERRIPAIYSRQENVQAGGLMSYGSNRRELRLPVGRFVRKIVAGVLPGEIPVQIPSKFDLAVNLGAAERAGLKLPTSVLARATVFR